MSLDLINRFFSPLLSKLFIEGSEKKGYKCKLCKEKMAETHSYLYLIPARIDDVHEESSAYYLKNATPIQSQEQIPTGNRACYITVFQCQTCGYRDVSVVDFLKVRDKEIIKGGDVYSYKEFKDFLAENQAFT